MPPADTPAQFVRDSAEHDPHDPCGPGDVDLQLAEIERQFQDGPLRTAHHADMTLAEVLRAVPPTSRRAPDQKTVLDAALAYLDEVAGGMQARKRRKLEWWIRAHVWFASWGGEGRAPRGVSSPGRQTVCDLICNEKTGKPMSETSYKRCRRFWEDGGFTAIVREGWTPDLSPGVLRDPGKDHNTTQAYVLCIPTRAAKKARRRRHGSPSDETGPLSGFSNTEDSPTRTREREGNPENRSGASSCYQPGSPARPEPAKPAPREAGLRVGVLARVTDGWFRHLTRLFTGLSVPDLLWVIDHQPDGAPHLGTDDHVRHATGWLRHRLSFWLNPDGTRRPTPREQAAERADLHRRQLADARAEADRVAAAKASPEGQQAGAAGAAEQLAARSSSAAKVMARRAAERPAGAVPAPRPPAAPVTRPAAAGRSVASLARQLHQLKEAGQLDDQARAEALGTWHARRNAPETPHDGPGATVPAQPPAAAAAPARGGSGGTGPYDSDPEWRALMDAAAAAARAEEADWRTAAESPGDDQESRP